ncbi:hypothetical protein SYNTR_0890 [Candidatus Syntrophocurvum alkaliphilum]|uniref:Uncharacterized protein n=1 Tax=Candidatus Syntrophocurvum alkaliphilum TaxID=2293317 RepID=A0A6I6DGM2_9FIRM|nr:hypothetical protein [Candidatus Syntrophocurvum alkaliphilum]QGT99483.1 hypothetical protein SYNTR_0890 [Candidatus Syntrophocurvum alkaliphilum]
MKYTLNTDIFDKNLSQELNNVIETRKDSFVNGMVYKLTVSFHVDLLHDQRFEDFVVPIKSNTNKNKKKDIINELLSFQLKELEQVLNNNGIEIYNATIQGNYLEAINIIKIQISEDTSEPTFTGRGKNKRRMKCFSIIPSIPYIQDKSSNILSEIYAKRIYDEILDKQNKVID